MIDKQRDKTIDFKEVAYTVGRLETQAGLLCYSLEAEFLFLQETSDFALNPFK